MESEATNWGSRPFWSLDAWFSHSGFTKLVAEEWKNMGGVGMDEKLLRIRDSIKKWNREVFSMIDRKF